MKDGISQVIVNLEAQKDEPTSYHILNRAVFYVSRLVSSQKERDFVKTNYNDIKRVLSMRLSIDEKLGIMEKEYHIPVDERIREDVSAMCNLSQGIRDEANAKIIMNMHRKGYTSEQIAEIVEKSEEEVKTIIEKRDPVLI